MAHLDLRPVNIMGRLTPKRTYSQGGEDVIKMEMKLVAFEYAIQFQRVIPMSFIDSKKDDPRFPFSHLSESEKGIASALHNDFFVSCIEAWLSDPSNEDFDHFMIS